MSWNFSLSLSLSPPPTVRQTYDKEMRYGHISTSIAKVLLFGIAGSGKTSVTAIVMGEDPPAIRMSTPLMVHPIQVIPVLIKELTKWEMKTQEEVRKTIAEIIRSRESYSESQLNGSKSPRTYKPKPPQPKQFRLKESQQPLSTLPKSNSKFDSVLEVVMKEDDLLSPVHNCDPPTEPILKQRWLYIIDSGGLPEFHNMLSIFVQNTTACIFVFRMHEGLDDCPPLAYYKDGMRIGPLQHSRLTNRQIFQQFMCTMRSFNSKDFLKSPPSILLLATHRDLVDASKLPELLEERHKQLKAIVLPQFEHHLIFCDEQMEKFIFTMNGKSPEGRDRETANAIRELITKQCLGEEANIPIRWHNLNHQSRRISDCLNRKVLSRDEYGKIAKSLNIDNESCESALNFFHRLNTIIYFPKVLPNVVFLDPQILLNLLNELVVKKYQTDRLPIKLQKYHFQFCDFAQVTEELLNEFKEHYHPPLFTSKHLVHLFEKLLIFGKLEEGAWFVPSILPFLKDKEVEQHCVSKEKALLIHFPDGGPQNGLFCSTVSYLVSSYNTSPCPWNVLKDPSGKPKCLKRNVISFTVGNFPGMVTLIEEWTHFEVHITRDLDEDEIWKLVYKAVFEGLERAAETHHYSNIDDVPEPAILCPGQHHDHASKRHPATINPKGNWKCTQSQEWFGQVSIHTIPWLKFILVTPGV